jgi:hypothetical protein
MTYTIWTFYIKKYDVHYQKRGWLQITHEEAQDLIYSDFNHRSAPFVRSMMRSNKTYAFNGFLMMMEGYPCTDVKGLAA